MFCGRRLTDAYPKSAKPKKVWRVACLHVAVGYMSFNSGKVNNAIKKKLKLISAMGDSVVLKVWSMVPWGMFLKFNQVGRTQNHFSNDTKMLLGFYTVWKVAPMVQKHRWVTVPVPLEAGPPDGGSSRGVPHRRSRSPESTPRLHATSDGSWWSSKLILSNPNSWICYQDYIWIHIN